MPYRTGGRWHQTEAEREQGEEYCEIDGKKIEMMSAKGTGVCSENCRKARDGDDLTRYGQ